MLDQLLAALDVRAEAFGVCEICRGWRLSFDGDSRPSVHYVLSGSGAILVPDHGPIALSPDTLVVLPRDVPHSFEGPSAGNYEIQHEQFGGIPAGGAMLPILRAGDGEQCLKVACGTIHAEFSGSLGLFDRLMHPLVESFVGEPLGARFEALLDELARPSFGTRALTEAFLKQAVVLVLRR